MSANVNPHGLKIGSVVYDSCMDMPATVAEINGPMFSLVRPTKFRWQTRWTAVRPATEYEQLRAIARLHAQRLRGTSPA